MKTLTRVAVLVAMILLVQFPIIGNAQVLSHCRTFFLSNELGAEDQGGLIDKLIATGHGSESLYQVLQFLTTQPGTGIPADFMTNLASAPPDSDAFTAPLSDFSEPSNNPIGIGEDGHLLVGPITGRHFSGVTGFVTNTVQYTQIGPTNFTMATSSDYYFSSGVMSLVSYDAIGIAWTPLASIPTLNEWGTILFTLTLAVCCMVVMRRRKNNGLGI